VEKMTDYFRSWKKLDTGFYRANHYGVTLFFMVAYVLVLAWQFYSSGKFNYISLLVIAVIAFNYGNEYRRYGKNGRPIVSIQGDEVFFDNAAPTGGAAHVNMAEIEELIIHGPTGRRIYRFIKKDKSHVELIPTIRRSMEDSLAEFLIKQLQPGVKISVKEPSTFFAAIRGDSL
jgi:hypothetical protein